MVTSNRTTRLWLYEQFHRHVCSAEWVWMGFCFVLFQLTFQPVDFIFKKIKFPIPFEKPTNIVSEFPYTKSCQDRVTTALFRKDINCPNQQFPHCLSSYWHHRRVTVAT